VEIRAIVLTLALGASPISASVLDPNEPPATPAGGTPTASITAGTVIGAAILVGALAALTGGGGADVQVPATGTTGTNAGTGTR